MRLPDLFLIFRNDSSKVTMVLFPATGDDQESKYVTLTLELTLPPTYPKVSPVVRFRNPRGLSETLLDSLYRNMMQVCHERLESQMVFELIDMGKDFLTSNNRPASECPICLLSFTSCDIFFRSHCFHHFHSYCLGRYLQNLMQVAASGDHVSIILFVCSLTIKFLTNNYNYGNRLILPVTW